MPSYKLSPDPTRKPGPIIAGDPSERGTDQLLLGHSAEAGPFREVWLDVSGEQVIAVFGKRGTGKSYTLGVLMEGLSAGCGDTRIAHLETPRGALVLDIMDIFWTSTLALEEGGPPQIKKQFAVMKKRGFSSMPLNVDVWVPAGHERPDIDPPGVHPLFISPSDLSLDDWGSLFDVDIFTEPRGMLIADAVQHVSSDGYTRTDGTQAPGVANFAFADLLDCLNTDADLLRNYQDTTLRSIRQRMTSYAALPLFTSPGTPLGDVIQAFRTAVLMLGRVPDALKRVIVAVLLRQILRIRRDVSFAQKRLDLDASLPPDERHSIEEFVTSGLPRTWVLMDEAHVLVGSGQSSVASAAIVKYAKEGRNYGLSLAVATQQPSALDQSLLSQVETVISHQLTAPQDAAVAAKGMRSPAPTQIQIDGENADVDGILRRLSQGDALFSCGNAPSLQRSCVISVRPRITAHGGYEA
jgi:uncharacterized protein